jgi:ribosomal-protein-alanine N-acetyltransferase
MLELNLHPFTPLETERLLLRQITFDDAEDIHVIRSNEAVMEFINRPLPKSIDDTKELVQRVYKSFETSDGILWGITLKGDPTVVGTMAFWRIEKEHHRAEIGYLLRPDFQGKGIMQEALTVALKYAFDTMKLHSIEANVNPQNAASIKLLERNGFVREGYFKENFFANGKFFDTATYSLVTSEK